MRRNVPNLCPAALLSKRAMGGPGTIRSAERGNPTHKHEPRPRCRALERGRYRPQSDRGAVRNRHDNRIDTAEMRDFISSGCAVEEHHLFLDWLDGPRCSPA